MLISSFVGRGWAPNASCGDFQSISALEERSAAAAWRREVALPAFAGGFGIYSVC